jgi:hypothetical protein
MTPEECAKLVPGGIIIDVDGAFMVMVNDPLEEEVKLARVAFSAGKMRYSSLANSTQVNRNRG